MSPSKFSHDILLNLSCARSFEYCNQELQKVKFPLNGAAIERITSLLLNTLKKIQGIAPSTSPGYLQWYRNRIVPFSQLLLIYLNVSFTNEMEAEEKHFASFLKGYFRFMGPELSLPTVLRDLTEAVHHPNFRDFWIAHDKELFAFFDKRFNFSIPSKGLDNLLFHVIINFEDYKLDCVGKRFLKLRISRANSLIYCSFLRNLLRFNQSKPCEPNSLLWGICTAKGLFYQDLRIKASTLFTFLLLGQRRVSVCPAWKRTNRHLAYIVHRLAEEKLLNLSACLEWRGLNKKALVNHLLDENLKLLEPTQALSVLFTAFEWGMTFDEEMKDKLLAFLQRNNITFEEANQFCGLLIVRTTCPRSEEIFDLKRERVLMHFDEGLESVRALSEQQIWSDPSKSPSCSD